MKFADRLHEVRIKRGITQKELARRMKIKAPVLSRYERNESKPSIEVATNLAINLNVSLDYLVGISNWEGEGAFRKKWQRVMKLTEADKGHVSFYMDILLKARER